jgi:hypothetical protein
MNEKKRERVMIAASKREIAEAKRLMTARSTFIKGFNREQVDHKCCHLSFTVHLFFRFHYVCLQANEQIMKTNERKEDRGEGKVDPQSKRKS